jgi:hypothetical protein
MAGHLRVVLPGNNGEKSMSAFLVNERTMQSACEAILFAEDATWYGEYCEYKAEAITKLGRELYALNNDALDTRYPHDAEGRDELEHNFMGRSFELVRPRRCFDAAMVQRFKSLGCLLYQCTEGDVPDSELFKRAEIAKGKLAIRMVEASAIYDAAKWGLSDAA